MTFEMVHTQRTVRVKCAVYPMLHQPPPLPMHMYGQRAAQNGRLWVTFFVTKYRDLFCDQGGGGGWGGVRAGPPPPARCIRPCPPPQKGSIDATPKTNLDLRGSNSGGICVKGHLVPSRLRLHMCVVPHQGLP